MSVKDEEKFRKKFTNILNLYKKSGLIKNSPLSVTDVLIKVINELRPEKKVKVFDDISHSVFHVNLNGPIVFILDTKNKKLIKEYLQGKSLPRSVVNKLKQKIIHLQNSRHKTIKDYYNNHVSKMTLKKASKLVLGITIPTKVKKNKLLSILTSAIISKAKNQENNIQSQKKVSILGEGSGKVIDVDNFLDKLAHKTFIPKQKQVISHKKPRLTKLSQKPK